MELFAQRKERRISGVRKRHETARVIRRTLQGVFAVIFLAGVVYVTRLPFFTVERISVEGGETIGHELVRKEVERELEGAYGFIIPKRFTFLIPEERIHAAVSGIPRIASVALAKPSRKELHVTFSEYEPHALRCTDDPAAPCWFMDREGYAFAEAPALSGGSLIRHTREGGGEIEEGQAVETDRLKAMETFIEKVASVHGLRTTALLYRENGDVELSINGGGKILLSGGKDTEASFENLTAVLASPEFNHIAPGNFKYIDIRFDNKVFVNEEFEEEEEATTTENFSDV